MPTLPRPPCIRRPAALLVGGAALLVALVVTQTFLSVPRHAPSIDAPRVRTPINPSLSDPAALASPTLTDASALPAPAAPATLADVMIHAAAGHFSAAAALALTLHPDQAPAAVASVFSLWAQQAPEEAAAAALALDDPAARDRAWQAVIATWSAVAPAGLASHSLTLPEGPARRQSLDAAITGWLAHDAPAAMDWIGRLPSGPETDGAVALVAQHPDLLHPAPDLAVSWAESIRDPALRSRILGRVVRAWRESTPAAVAAADHYARTSPDLSPSEREDILVGERFTAHP